MHRRGASRRLFTGPVVGVIVGRIANRIGAGTPLVDHAVAVADVVGNLFLRLLFVMVVPLVVSALSLAVADIGDLGKPGRLVLVGLHGAGRVRDPTCDRLSHGPASPEPVSAGRFLPTVSRGDAGGVRRVVVERHAAHGVAGGSLPLVAVIAQSVGVPAEGIGLILGVDRLLDMCRTVLNVTGDLVVAACVGGPRSGRDRWQTARDAGTCLLRKFGTDRSGGRFCLGLHARDCRRLFGDRERGGARMPLKDLEQVLRSDGSFATAIAFLHMPALSSSARANCRAIRM